MEDIKNKMSYEGYSQFICKNGHYWTEDCYSEAEIIKDNKCPICKQSAVWRNMVDVTNGSFDDETGERIDGYVELKIKSETSGVCSVCGKKHVCETIYEVPSKK